MKKTVLITLLFCSVFNIKIFAQEKIMGDINYNLLEKYIESAKAHYLPKKISELQAEGIKTNISIAEVSYLDILNASYIYRPNDQTAIAGPGVTGNPYLVNGFQFGVNLNLGSFFEKPYQIKRAKIDYQVAQLNAQEFNNTLAYEVKNRYYNYIQQVAQLKLSTQNLQDISLIADGIKNKFEKTQVSIEVYDQSRVTLTAAKMAQLGVEVNLQKAKDALEQIIGVKLTEIN